MKGRSPVIDGEADHATMNSCSLQSAMDLIHCSAGRNFERPRESLIQRTTPEALR
jgi:hypothetical protein